jgi:hypothetical protein
MRRQKATSHPFPGPGNNHGEKEANSMQMKVRHSKIWGTRANVVTISCLVESRSRLCPCSSWMKWNRTQDTWMLEKTVCCLHTYVISLQDVQSTVWYYYGSKCFWRLYGRILFECWPCSLILRYFKEIWNNLLIFTNLHCITLRIRSHSDPK